jgi:uncharacterized protein (TIGR03118 family)
MTACPFVKEKEKEMTARVSPRVSSPLVIAVLMALATSITRPASANGYVQDNLVSDIPGAVRTDHNLVNPWGLAAGPNTPLWVANAGTGVSTIYQGNSRPVPSPEAPLVVTIPPPPGSTETAEPTGIVFNGTSGFAVAPGKPARFIFATEQGTISGWNPDVDPTHAILEVAKEESNYKGLALLGGQLIAANFEANSVDVFNSDFSPAGSFTDTTLPPGFAPFNVQDLGGRLLVTFALQDEEKEDDVKGPGNGFADLFDPATHAFTRLIAGGTPDSPLNAPWGLALAPGDFGPFSGKLLVGNFGDGRINAFDPTSGAFLGPLLRPDGSPIEIEGLWALRPGFDPAERRHPFLFFTAGIDDEAHGLFGRIDFQQGSRPRLRRYN